jgi:predicted acylesterase/phospholipase RssA
MYTSSVDCYTGERLIVSQAAARKNGIPLVHGEAASSSLPGTIGPTLLGQRYGMDGGICSNAAHVDVVGGVDPVARGQSSYWRWTAMKGAPWYGERLRFELSMRCVDRT